MSCSSKIETFGGGHRGGGGRRWGGHRGGHWGGRRWGGRGYYGGGYYGYWPWYSDYDYIPVEVPVKEQEDIYKYITITLMAIIMIALIYLIFRRQK